MPKLRAVDDRFWEKVDKTETCWLWTAQIQRDGYGKFWVGRDGIGHRLAHQVAFFLTHGRYVAEGMELDHLCRTPACVRPDHLDEVTHKVNVRRSAICWDGVRPKICPKGHVITDDNIAVSHSASGKVKRWCRTCNQERALAHYYRKKNARAAG